MNEREVFRPEMEEEVPPETWHLVQEETGSYLAENEEYLEEWRKLDEEGRVARQTRKMVEVLSGARKAIERHPEREEQLRDDVFNQLKLSQISSSSPLVLQFQAAVTARALNLPPPATREEVKRLCQSLESQPSTAGLVNCFELLASSILNLSLKERWIRAQILPRLSFLNRKDLEEAKKISPPPPLPPEKPPELPPQEEDSLRPSIDEREKEEGEPTGYFVVAPFYGGYYKEQVFEVWDSPNLCFRSETREKTRAGEVAIDIKTERVMGGVVSSGKTPLPCPYGFAFKPDSLEFPPGQKIELLEDEQGNYSLQSEGPGISPFSIILGKREVPPTHARETPEALEITTGRLNQKTETLLEELQNDISLNPLEKARRLKQYVKNLLEYPAEGDSRYNAIYYQEPSQFFQKIEQYKKADCDVANAFFVALLSRLQIPARLIGGHYIKIKDHQGRAVFSSATRHAWTEIWDNGWYRLDATPKGAPELDEEETDERKEDEDFEGDFGEIEAEILSDEELANLIEGIKKKKEEAEKRKIEPQELRVLNFAQEANCSKAEASQILKELQAARELKDRAGRNILNLLSQEFLKIIKENFKEVPSYRVPVRLPESDELEEPVEAFVEIKAGEAEPSGFKKYERKLEKVNEYGGFDLILVADKSGSMKDTDPQTGQPKYLEQRTFAFLVLEALHKFSQYCQRNRIKMLNPIDVRTALITFREGSSNIVLPLSEKWGPQDQYTLWKALGENIGGGTPDHLGLQTAAQLIREDTAQSKIKENVNIVEAVGLTPAAREIEATYYPNGQCLPTVGEAPSWVAERIIKNVEHLYPQKVERRAPSFRPASKRLRLIIVTADGGSDNKSQVQATLLQLKSP